jgi:hypothetical protein
MHRLKREARFRADVPAIHAFTGIAKTWMAGTSPAMTETRRAHAEVILTGVKQFTSAHRYSGYQKVRTPLVGGTNAITRQSRPNEP